jgi:hypothetical protein
MFWTKISFGKNSWTALTLDPNKQSAQEVGYELDFEDVGADDANSFVPLYIPEYTVPPVDENNVLYFRVEVNSNYLASFGGKLSYTLISEPDNNASKPSLSNFVILFIPDALIMEIFDLIIL